MATQTTGAVFAMSSTLSRSGIADATFVALTVASFGLLVFAFTTSPIFGVVGLLLGVVAESQTSKRSSRLRTIDRTLGLGANIRHACRILLMTAIIAEEGLDAGATTLAAAAFGVASVTSLAVAKGVLTAAVRRPIPETVHNLYSQLPLAEPYRRRRRAQRHLDVVSAGTAALVFLTGLVARGHHAMVLGVSAAALVAVIASLVIYFVVTVRHDDTGGHLASFREVVRRYDPEVLVYVVAAPTEFYFVEQWLAAFDSLDQRVLFVTRQRAIADRLVGTHSPVVFAPDTRSVEACIGANTRMAFYTANTGRNVHLVHRADLTHIFLNHGDSDKASSANPVVKMYDEVWLAGQGAIDRYERAGISLDPSSVRLVGRPQTQGLVVGHLPRSDGERKTVLYAPTFEGHYGDVNYSSVAALGPQLISAILESSMDLNVIYRPHPGTGRHLATVAEASARIIERLNAEPTDRRTVVLRGSQHSIADNMNEADVLITDVSSVATDFMATGRPIIVTNPTGLDTDDYIERFPNLASCYLLGPNASEIEKLLEQALGPDPLATARIETGRYLLGVHPDGPIRTFVNAANEAFADHTVVDRASQFRLG